MLQHVSHIVDIIFQVFTWFCLHLFNPCHSKNSNCVALNLPLSTSAICLSAIPLPLLIEKLAMPSKNNGMALAFLLSGHPLNLDKESNLWSHAPISCSSPADNFSKRASP